MKQDRRRQRFDEIKNRGVHRWRVLFSAADRQVGKVIESACETFSARSKTERKALADMVR